MDPLEYTSSSEPPGLFSTPPSPPSEPPDIRNWFQSYEYESPESSGVSVDFDSQDEEWKRKIFSEKLQSPQSIERYSYTFGDCTIRNRRCPHPKFVSVPEARDKELIQGSIFHCIQHHASPPNSVFVKRDQIPLDGSPRVPRPWFVESENHENSITSSMERPESPDTRTVCGSIIVTRIPQGAKTMPAHGDDHPKKDEVATGSWVSTGFGKRSRTGDENLLMKDSMKIHVSKEDTSHLDATFREPLGERINFLCRKPEENEEAKIPGKWQCPRKNKPPTAPPMKQLRLEIWIRRISS